MKWTTVINYLSFGARLLLLSVILTASSDLALAEFAYISNNLPKVISFSLINADADVTIMPLVDGQTINLAKLPTNNLNIKANLDPEVVGSVEIILNGSKRIENVAPYAAKGDNNGDYFNWVPNVGTYQLSATPYTGPKATGSVGEGLSITFMVVNDASRPELLVRNYWDLSNQYCFLLDQGESDKFYFTLESSNAQILPTASAISVVDNTTNDTPSWVAFPSSVNQGVGYEFFINTTGLSPGIYNATVVFGPVQGYDDGIVYVKLEVSAVPLPFLEFNPSVFNLNFEQGAEARAEYTLTASDGNENGAAQLLAIDLASNKPASWLSFTSATNFNTIYDFFIDSDMPPGTYYATLFSKAFTLLSGVYKNAQADIILVLDPAFKVASFMLINADTDQFMRFLFDGSEVDLSTLPTANLNIQAKTYPNNTGSVKFMVNNTSRTENFFPYAAFGDQNGDYFPWTPQPGNYQITATPYAEAQLKGSQGESLSINVTFTNPMPAANTTNRENPDRVLQLITYPNPTSNELFMDLRSPETNHILLDMYNTTNSFQVFEGMVEANERISIPLNVSGLKNGIYYIRAVSGSSSISSKVIISH